MAGNTNTPPAIWNVGDSVGKGFAGGTAALPASPSYVGTGTDTPTASPPAAGSPLFILTPAEELFVWGGTAWVGPYGLGSTFAASSHTHT
jgi:hypothetical protein